MANNNHRVTLTIDTEFNQESTKKAIKGLEDRLSKLSFKMDNASAKKAARNFVETFNNNFEHLGEDVKINFDSLLGKAPDEIFKLLELKIKNVSQLANNMFSGSGGGSNRFQAEIDNLRKLQGELNTLKADLAETKKGLDEFEIIPKHGSDGLADGKKQVESIVEEYRKAYAEKEKLEKESPNSAQYYQSLLRTAQAARNLIGVSNGVFNNLDATHDKELFDIIPEDIGDQAEDFLETLDVNSEKFKKGLVAVKQSTQDEITQLIEMGKAASNSSEQIDVLINKLSKYKAMAEGLEDGSTSYDDFDTESQSFSVGDSNKDNKINEIITSVIDGEFDVNKAAFELLQIYDNQLPNAMQQTIQAAAPITQQIKEADKAATGLIYHLGNLIDGTGMPRDNFGEMIHNLTSAAEGGRYESYGYGIMGGGLFGVTDPSKLDEQPIAGSNFIQSIDVSKYNMYLIDTEERVAKFLEFMSKLQKFSIKGAVPDYTSFDNFLGDTSYDSLYAQFGELFDQSRLTKDEFIEFIESMKNLLKEAGIQYSKESDELVFSTKDNSLLNSENISTRFLKQLGYQGVSVGNTSLDGFGQGNVLFDFKQEDIVGYFNTLEQAIQNYKDLATQGMSFNDNEKLKEYANNINEILTRLENRKKVILGDFHQPLDTTIQKLKTIQEQINLILNSQNSISSRPSSNPNIQSGGSNGQSYSSTALPSQPSVVEPKEPQIAIAELQPIIDGFNEIKQSLINVLDKIGIQDNTPNVDADFWAKGPWALETTLQQVYGVLQTNSTATSTSSVDSISNTNIEQIISAIDRVSEKIYSLNEQDNGSTTIPESVRQILLKDVYDIIGGIENLDVVFGKSRGYLESFNYYLDSATEEFAKVVNVLSSQQSTDTFSSANTNQLIQYLSNFDLSGLLNAVDNIDASTTKIYGEISANSIEDVYDLLNKNIDKLALDKTLKDVLTKINQPNGETKNNDPSDNQQQETKSKNKNTKSFKINRLTTLVNNAQTNFNRDTVLPNGFVVNPQMQFALDNYKQALLELQNERDKIAKNPSMTKDLKQFDELIQKVKDARVAFNELKKYGTEFNSKSNNILRIDDTINTYEDADNAIKKYVDSLGIQNAKIKEGNIVQKNGELVRRNAIVEYIDEQGVIHKLSVAYDKATNSVGTFGDKTKSGVNKLDRIMDRVKNKSIELISYVASFASFYKLISIIRNGITEVQKIDSALAQIQIVTGTAGDSLQMFANQAIDSASKIGIAVTDLMNSVETWARLGYNLNDSLQLANYTAMFSNVANTDLNAATDSITSILKAYQYDASDISKITDILTKVGQDFAVSASELGIALQEGGATLASANNTLEESVALVAAGNAAIQDASKVGNALKTTSMRIRGAKEELKEAGEEVDEACDSASKMRDKILGLTGGVVDIMEADKTTFKSTMEIMKEIATVYDQLTDINQAALLENIAGKRNASVVASIIRNINDLTGAYEDAQNAAGTTERANRIYLDSIEGRTKKFSTDVTKLWKDTLDSGMIKTAVSLGDTLVNLIDKVGVLNTALIAISTISMVKTKMGPIEFFRSLFESIGNLPEKIQNTPAILSQALNAQGQIGVNSLKGLMTNTGVDLNNQQTLLTSMGLTDAQIASDNYNISLQSLNATMLENAVANKTLTTAQAEQLASKIGLKLETTELNVAEMSSALQKANITREQRKQIIADLELTQSKKKLTIAQITQTMASKGATPEMIKATLAEVGLGDAAAGSSAKVLGLSAAMKGMLISAVIAVAIVAITSAINKQKEAIQRAEDALKNYNDAQRKIIETNSTLAEIKGEYSELAQGVNELGENVNLTADQYERYNTIVNKIADMFPDMVHGYTEEGNAIIKNKGNVEALTEAYKKLKEQSDDTLITSAQDIMNDYKTTMKGSFWSNGSSKEIAAANKLKEIIKNQDTFDFSNFANVYRENDTNKIYSTIVSLLKEAGIASKKGESTPEFVQRALKEYPAIAQSVVNKWEAEINSALSNVKPLVQAYLNKSLGYVSLDDEQKNVVDSIVSQLDQEFFDQFDGDAGKMETAIENIIQNIKNANLNDEFNMVFNLKTQFNNGEVSYNEYKEKVYDFLEKIKELSPETVKYISLVFGITDTEAGSTDYDAMVEIVKTHLQDAFDDKAGTLTLDELKIVDAHGDDWGSNLTFDELKEKISSVKDEAWTASQSLDSISKSLDNVQSAYSTLSNAVQEYNENGYLTLDNLQALLELDPQYLACLEMENGQLQLNQSALQAMIETRLNEAEAVAIDTAIKQLNALASRTEADAMNSTVGATQNAIGILNEYGNVISDKTNQVIVMTGAVSKLNSAISQASQNPHVDKTEINQVLSTMDTTLQLIENSRGKLTTSFSSIVSPSSSGSSGSSGSSASSSKEFDFIDIYFNNLENYITEKTSELKTVLDDASKISTKQKLTSEITEYYRQEAASSKKVVDYYTKQAAIILAKIPSQYQNAIKNGSLDIASIGDSALSDLLSKYRDYVDKATSYTQKYYDMLETIETRAKELFDDIKTDYENKFSFNDIFTDQINNEIDAAETAGTQMSSAYYEALIKNANEKLGVLKAEQKKLLEVLQSGDVRVGTDTYYEMVKSLNEVDSAIDECQNSTVEWTNKINELKANNFDKFIDQITNLEDEISNLYDLISDDDEVTDEMGNWTAKGITALGLLIQQMQNAQYAADEIAKEITSLKPSDFSSYDLYQERLNELTDKQWEEIQAAESAKDAITQLNSTRIDAVKDGIQKEIDAYQKIIDKKKEALQAEKDAYDYQKTVADKQKSIADIQKQLAALSGDNSASANAKKKQLRADLYTAQQDLEDTYYQHSVDSQTEALDKSYEALEESKNKEIERLEAYLKNTEKLIEDSIVNVLTNADIVLQQLNQVSNDYSVSLSDNLKAPWESAAVQATTFKDIASSDIQELISEDGILNTFNIDGTNYLTTPFESGADAANQFKKSVNTVLDNVKSGLQSAYNSAVTYNNNIISACNQAIEAYKKVQQQSTVAAKVISTQNIPSSSGGGSSYPSMHAQDTVSSGGYYGYLTPGGSSKIVTINNERYFYDPKSDSYYPMSSSTMVDSGSRGATYYFKPGTKRYKYYAKGTLGTKQNDLAFIDELGEELVLNADKNGRLQYLTKGTSVIPADLTKKLMNLAVDPTSILERSRPQLGTPQLIANHMEVNMDIAEVIHIEHADKDSLPDIQKAVQTQLDKYMGKVNNSLRKFTR